MKLSLAASIAAVLCAAGAARAQDMSQHAMPAQTMPDAMVPGLGEIMSVQQMRHIKLWFAGRAGNWPLADYEVDELKEGFEDVSKLIGGDTVDKAVGAEIKALEKVIDDKDRSAFPAAFDKLSAACNACHKMLEHGFIKIQRPASLPYSDQAFEPQR
jgi:hypothetical protein